jgi:phage tail-like protein
MAGLNSNGQNFWMLSQLNDWLPAWRAATAYLTGQGLVDPNGNVQIVQAPGGVSGAAQPVWNTVSAAAAGAETPGAGATGDGTITWVNQGADTSQIGLFYCNSGQRLQLRSMRTNAPPKEDFAAATTLVQTAPMTFDTYGNYARWDAPAAMVVAGGSAPSDAPPPGEVPIYWPAQPNVTDLAMGYDGILYIAVGGALVLVDRRDRWPNFTLEVPGFYFWRLAALPEGGVLALDRNTPQLGVVTGQPLQTGPVDTPDPGVMRPCQANPNPPQLAARYALPAGEQFVALAPMDATQQPMPFALMSWASNSANNQAAYVRLFNGLTPASPRLTLGGVNLPYAIAWLGAQKLGVLATNLSEALVYDLSNVSLNVANTAESLVPTGDTYVLPANTTATPNAGPIVHGFQLPPNYMHPALAANPGATPSPMMLPLIPLSLNSVAATGATNPVAPAVIDSGTQQNVWHRLFFEAVVPPRTGAIVWLSAADSLAELYDANNIWYPHSLGDANVASLANVLPAEVPRAVWQSVPSEIPFGPTLLGSDPADAPVEGLQGLFMVLVQRTCKAVRALSGRFLGVRIQLNGNGRITPEIAGMRIYGPRFSYVQNYLPQLYREDKFGPAADKDGPSTRRDFFERFVNLFEAQLTRIEDRIANAYLLTRAESTPDQALPWLGGWIGINPDDDYPPDRSRARIQATPRLYRSRGTAQGITAALDVATGGMCRRGAIIVIEDYRLRHIFATILGADLSIKSDPLLPGYWAGSNSIVGDTLFLGDPSIQAELQALYETDLNIAGSPQAVQRFYDQLALRMTVFIHNQVENVNLNLVQRIVDAEKPAHVQAFVRVAQAGFMIGLASLLGVNTYLAPEPQRKTATIDVSDVGRYDVVMNAPSLDPRMENASKYEDYPKPIARINVPAAIPPGRVIVLDGSASTAPTGSTITSYQWTLLP